MQVENDAVLAEGKSSCQKLVVCCIGGLGGQASAEPDSLSMCQPSGPASAYASKRRLACAQRCLQVDQDLIPM